MPGLPSSPQKNLPASIKPHTSPSPASRAWYLRAAWLEPVPRQEFPPAAAGLVPSPGASLLVHRTRLDRVLFCPRQQGLARGSGSFLGEQAESWGVAETTSPWRLSELPGIARVQSGSCSGGGSRSGSGSACGKVLVLQLGRHADPSRHRPLPTARGYGVLKCCLCCGKMGPKKAQPERTADGRKAHQSPPFLPAPRLTPYCDPTLTTNLLPAAAHLTFKIRSKSCGVGGTGVPLSPGSLLVPLHGAVGAHAALPVPLHAVVGCLCHAPGTFACHHWCLCHTPSATASASPSYGLQQFLGAAQAG